MSRRSNWWFLAGCRRQLSLPPSTLDNELQATNNGKLSKIGKTQRLLTEIELALAKIKRELVEITMKRDLLKKAAAYPWNVWAETIERQAEEKRCQQNDL